MLTHLVGMERLNKAMAAYVRAISKRSEGEDKEKLFPIGNLGGVMVAHGEDFASNSEYGQCLTGRLSPATSSRYK